MGILEGYGYIDFKSINEEWTEYLLEDNTLIRLKSVPIKAKKKDKSVGFDLQKIVVAFSPKELAGEPSSEKYLPDTLIDSIKKSDISFKVIKEDWNEYELSDGSRISLKETLNSASSTDKFDSDGDPIYIIQSQTNYKGLPKK